MKDTVSALLAGERLAHKDWDDGDYVKLIPGTCMVEMYMGDLMYLTTSASNLSVVEHPEDWEVIKVVRVLKIASCYRCPHRDRRREFSYCRLLSPPRHLPKIVRGQGATIPAWCPLEESKS
jgi:hypothetical protein